MSMIYHWKWKRLLLIKFADDTVSKPGSSVEQVIDNLNEEMENAVNWFDNNHMSVNIGKTKAFFHLLKNSPISKKIPQKLK